MSALRGVERLLLCYLAFLAAVVALSSGPLGTLFALASVAVAIVVLATVYSEHWLRDFLPCLYIIACFELTNAAGAANPHHGDVLLATLDGVLWPGLFEEWYATAGRPAWLVELASVVYVSFYLVPVVVGALLYRRSRAAFQAFVSLVSVAFVASWLGYLALPATGPRVARGAAQALLGGGAISQLARRLVSLVELNRWDAFPSAHAMIALVVAASAFRSLPRARLPLLGWAAATVFSTVFLSYHYVIDVVAGALLAAIVVTAEWKLAGVRLRPAVRARAAAAR